MLVVGMLVVVHAVGTLEITGQTGVNNMHDHVAAGYEAHGLNRGRHKFASSSRVIGRNTMRRRRRCRAGS